MPKNYKRRGYPGKELKKKKKEKELSDYVQAYGYYSSGEKHERDCELERLRSHVTMFVGEIQLYKDSITNLKKELKKEKKEKATLEGKSKNLQRHIKTITPKRQPLIQSTAISRAIKNI